MLRVEKHNVFWQILIWWGGWLLIHLSLMDSMESLGRMVYRSFPVLAGISIIVFINIKYLIPRFLFSKNQLYFILFGVLLIVAVVLLIHLEIFPWYDLFHPFISERLNNERPPSNMKWAKDMMPMVIAFLGSTAVEISRYANRKEKEVIRTKNEKLETELKFLKSQVNPHFLFNALNNIYSLAVVQAPQTPESVMQLSEILRYMVYDSNAKRVSLNKEISYIENFVDLKLLKDSRGMNVQVDLDKTASNIMIPPLLFIPFVENAFKHSKIESLKDGFIEIKLKVDDKAIDFQVINSVPKNKFTQDEVGGVGLENVKKRLLLLYPEHQHELNILPSDDKFEVHLKLQIDEKN